MKHDVTQKPPARAVFFAISRFVPTIARRRKWVGITEKRRQIDHWSGRCQRGQRMRAHQFLLFLIFVVLQHNHLDSFRLSMNKART
ncbi:hypothetical protein [Silvimonas sp.]|uniref:hypothetical protein n=1 Tax=Silvimonas sp. TaxID=2650811 RepID=UPI0028480B1C|nr:hypothetical protein [Silvimonas sp.]MDR3430233.1 hypothetical protein [Silvimonas sp.]